MQTMQNSRNGRINISKLEAARRQLETAIWLYFNGGDPVSTHTLACAAVEILSDLNDEAKGTPMVLDLNASGAIRPDKIKLAHELLRRPQNFFKHADKDLEAVLDFHPEIPAGFILSGIEKYRELSRENLPTMRVFALWFRMQWPDVFHFSNGEDVALRRARAFFNFNDKAKFFAHFLPLYQSEANKTNTR